MVKYTKKGTPVKNKSYKFGILGEYYVVRHIKCPHCQHRLIALPPSTPALDCKCANAETPHWFQIKTYQEERLRPQDKWLLHTGQYDLQYRAFFDTRYLADVLVLRYQERTKQVKSLHWFQNQCLEKEQLSPEGKNNQKSRLIVYSQQATQLPLPRTHLPDDFSYEKVKPEKAPQWKIECAGEIVCLNNQSCSCCLTEPATCSHLEQAWDKFKKVAPSHRHRVVGSQAGVEYAVDLDTQTCTCPAFRNRKKATPCKHLQAFPPIPPLPPSKREKLKPVEPRAPKTQAQARAPSWFIRL